MKKTEMLLKFTSHNGRILSLKNKQTNLKKIIFKRKKINVKLDPQNIDLKELICFFFFRIYDTSI